MVESPIFTHGSAHIHDGMTGHGPAHVLVDTPARYKSPTNVGIAVANGRMNGVHDSDHHAGGIPMAKTRSSSPDHHHFQDFSYISTSHLPRHGFLDQELDLDEH